MLSKRIEMKIENNVDSYNYIDKTSNIKQSHNLEDIKNKINNGTYKINLNVVSEKIANELLNK